MSHFLVFYKETFKALFVTKVNSSILQLNEVTSNSTCSLVAVTSDESQHGIVYQTETERFDICQS